MRRSYCAGVRPPVLLTLASVVSYEYCERMRVYILHRAKKQQGRLSRWQKLFLLRADAVSTPTQERPGCEHTVKPACPTYTKSYIFTTADKSVHFRYVHGLYVTGINIKIHSSCEIEFFVESRLCKLCVILRSRVLRVVWPH